MRATQLIRLDWMAGAAVGVLVLALHGWLMTLWQLPSTLVLSIGLANLAYACVSFTLARRSRGDRVPGLRAMAVANLVWTVVCAVLAAIWFGRASIFGMGQLIGEGLFVGWLGVQEWRAAGQPLVADSAARADAVP